MFAAKFCFLCSFFSLLVLLLCLVMMYFGLVLPGDEQRSTGAVVQQVSNGLVFGDTDSFGNLHTGSILFGSHSAPGEN